MLRERVRLQDMCSVQLYYSSALLASLGDWEMEMSTSMQETQLGGWPYVWVYIRVSYRGFPQKFENYDVVIATRVYNTISNYRLNLLQLNPIIILSLKNVHHFIKNLQNLASFPDSPHTWTKNQHKAGWGLGARLYKTISGYMTHMCTLCTPLPPHPVWNPVHIDSWSKVVCTVIKDKTLTSTTTYIHTYTESGHYIELL